MSKKSRKSTNIETAPAAAKPITKKTLPKWPFLVAAALLLGAGVVGALTLPGMSKFEKAKVVNGTVAISLSKVSDGAAHFYRYADGGSEIRFFVVKGSDGQIHTAFDSCDVCFREKKGYEQAGDAMVCKNCGKRFQTNRIGPHTVGGCNPSYLPHANDGRSVIVSTAELKQGARLF
ncbi:DUF2318 domain-containing protein [Geobacter sp.]|uniref:DUF2318 domain-containing protein n=1 Tax=Geobacter sp. TaxID=46610 RepID=UPI00262D9AE8|nr:DUF2318 domain-containing protein [Geobacter sp.]